MFDDLIEARIQGAMARGEFDDLPDAGKPLQLEDDSSVPEELRMAYRILKNAGFVPPEVELRNNIEEIQTGLAGDADSERRRRNLKKLQYLFMQMDESRRRQVSLVLQQEYYDRILDKL